MGQLARLRRLVEGRLQNDELVAAEAPDHVGAANYLAQPVSDLGEQRVTTRMTERVVDLLELVEVDEQDRQRSRAGGGRQDARQLVVKMAAIGQASEGIVARQVADALLGLAPLADVLDHHHRAAVLHRLGGEGERLSLPDLGEAAARPTGKARLEGGNEVPGVAMVGAGQGAAVPQHLAGVDAGDEAVRLHLEEAGDLCVGHDQPLVGVEHAQAMRHVVERRVEALGELGDVAGGDDGVEQRAAQPVRNELQRREEGRQHQQEEEIVVAAHIEEGGAERDAGADDLRGDQQVAGEIAPRRADQVAEDDGEAEDLDEGVGGGDEGGKGPGAEQGDIGGRADDVAVLPAPHLDAGERLVPNSRRRHACRGRAQAQ